MNAPTPLAVLEPTKPVKQYHGTAAKILNYLASGATQVQAAEALGVTEGLVSQLCAEEDFMAQVGARIHQDLERAQEIDNNIEDVERILAKRLKEITGYIMTPDSVLRALKIVNSLHRKTQPMNPLQASGAGAQVNNVLKLLLPKVIVNQFVVNPNNEIVAVGSQNLVTLNSQSMDSMVQARKRRAQLAQELSKPELTEDAEITHTYVKSNDPWSNL